MRGWKRFGIFALVGLLLSWIVSCSSPRPTSQAAGGTQTVEFWTMQLKAGYEDYFNQLIAEFESQNPGIQVKWVDVPWASMESKILTAVSAKTAPDVVNLNPNFASQLAGQNAWMILDDKMSQADRDLYLPKIWQASTLDNKSFAIPWYLTTRVTIYNTDLLKQAGIEQPPATYAELANVAKQVREKTGKYAFFITFVPEDSGEVLESLVQMGVRLVDDQGKAAFNTPEGKQAFQYWVDLYQQGLLPKEVLTQGHRRAIELYQSGETAVLASGAEFLGAIAKNAPSIAQVSASAPQISGETGKKNVAVMNLVIPRDTDQPEAALKFALFVTNDQHQLSFAKAANVLPSTQGALNDAYFKTAPDNASSVEKARIVSASQLKDAEVLIPTMKGMKQLQKIVYSNLQSAMLKQKSVDQAIADAAKEWDAQAATVGT
ncbi:sugar ABC transporter substrate-binding protein [Geitlerinema sp. PCC 7407]|uniref:ABC transporter substrate-binding protein n=1 Tax=Geitlerinema sp. PCC 7407 TaxID=1173025 RepID=UPI00029FFDFD|nr:sugar ABC transporter substrate-binding protein [Geitlerinema sp. PCC 7407]AFY67398.1 carbohydrate ABC transporter substrate-binding protein, CUT1 family [Geitlerinema sp. PCC 7407]